RGGVGGLKLEQLPVDPAHGPVEGQAGVAYDHLATGSRDSRHLSDRCALVRELGDPPMVENRVERTVGKRQLRGVAQEQARLVALSAQFVAAAPEHPCRYVDASAEPHLPDTLA